LNILLATQGSQGVVAIRELFAQNIAPEKIHVAVCENGANGPLSEFISYNKMSCSFHKSGSEFTSWLMIQSKSYDVLLSISWKYLFCEKVIEYFDGKAINFHPGVLPDYRGCFSTPWSIINDEKQVGFTYHYISKGFDEGNILLEETLIINGLDTAHALNYRLFQLGLSRLKDAIRLIGRQGKPQETGGRYYPNSLPFDGRLDDKWSNRQKNLFIRAMYFPPHETFLNLLDETLENKKDTIDE
jgi:methionyl-tRNA formyltransferase